jgi:hypothetical protein
LNWVVNKSKNKCKCALSTREREGEKCREMETKIERKTDRRKGIDEERSVPVLSSPELLLD